MNTNEYLSSKKCPQNKNKQNKSQEKENFGKR